MLSRCFQAEEFSLGEPSCTWGLPLRSEVLQSSDLYFNSWVTPSRLLTPLTLVRQR